MRLSILAVSSEAKGDTDFSSVIYSMMGHSMPSERVTLLTCMCMHDDFFESHDNIFRKKPSVWILFNEFPVNVTMHKLWGGIKGLQQSVNTSTPAERGNVRTSEVTRTNTVILAHILRAGDERSSNRNRKYSLTWALLSTPRTPNIT
jgi:hypothetical protein